MQPTQNPATLAEHPTRRVDGKPETDADRRFFDLRDAGYTGPINQDGYPFDETGAPVLVACCGECGLVSRMDVVCRYCESGTADAYRLDDDDRQDDAAIPNTPATVLRAAARYLVRHGWIQGAYYDATTGSFTPAACLVGALAVVCYGGPVDAPAQLFDHPGFAEFEAVLTFLDMLLMERFGVVAYDFNDAKGRIFPEILGALHGAADVWDRDHGGAA